MNPSLYDLKAFGCVAYAHIPDVHRNKLDVKSTKCVFLGASDESKAYKHYDIVKNKILISKGVTFEELKGYKRNLDDKEESNQITGNVDDDGEVDEVGAIDNKVNMDLYDPHYEINNVESASEDSAMGEQINSQRQVQGEHDVR